MSSSLRKGMRYETAARQYLERQGLTLLDTNFRCRGGEIDLVMRDQDTTCFIEVRYRKHGAYGGAAESITPRKRQRIIHAALTYLASQPRLMQQALRFDALLIDQAASGDVGFNWIRSAFDAE